MTITERLTATLRWIGTRLQWSFLFSTAIHGALFIWVVFFLAKPDLPTQFVVQLDETQVPPEQPEPETPKDTKPQAGKAIQRPAAARQPRPAQSRASARPGQASASTGSAEAAVAGGAPAAEPGVITDPGGIVVGGIAAGGGGTTASPATSPAGSGSGTSSGSGAGKGGGPGATATKRSGSPSAYGPPPGVPDPTVIAVPPALQRSTNSYEGHVYVEAERYVLHGPDLRIGIAVPGNELCINGNIVRTVYKTKQTQTITNLAQCTVQNASDEEVWRCPREAQQLAVVFDGYLVSPINYAINACLVYDKGQCYERRDEDRDVEVCRGTVKYEGIWEAGTNFQYRCLKAEVRKYSHSLQYRVRFLQDVTSLSDGGRGFTRVLGSEMRKMAACE